MHTDARYMQHLLACLQQGRPPAGGVAFSQEWCELAPDYTPASLERIGTLLRDIGAQQSGAFARLQNDRAGQNFLLTLAAYLVEYTAHHSRSHYTWQADGKASFGSWQFQPLLVLRLMLEGQKDKLNLDDTVWQAFRLNPQPDRDAMAAFLLNHFRRHRTAPQGLVYTKELAALPAETAGRTARQAAEALLLRLHHDEGIDQDNFSLYFNHYHGRNFLLLLTFYLGAAYAAEQGLSPRWSNTPDAGDPFYDGFVLMLHNRPLPLLRLIEHALCTGTPLFAAADDHPNAVCRRTVDGLLYPDADYGNRPPPAIAYADTLRAIGLDNSLNSLIQIDRLLERIRAARPDFHRFIHDGAHLNLLHFCAFYLARTAALLSHNTLKWLDYAEAKQQLDGLPEDWFSQYAAVIGQRIYFPLGRVLSRIWDEQPESSCADFARQLCRDQAGRLHLCPPPPDPAAPADLNGKTLRQAGFTTAYALHRLLNHEHLAPLLLEPDPERHWHLRQLIFPHDADAVAHGYECLHTNPRALPCRILCYEGYADLPHGRFSALITEIRTYRGGQALQVQALLPFTRSGSLHIGTLALNGLTADQAAPAAAAFYCGMNDFQAPQQTKGFWRDLYRPRL